MEDTKKLFEVIGRLADSAVLVIGDVMLDRYWSGMASRLSPEAPVPVVALEKVANIPGGAANVAANIAALGARAFLAGVVGADAAASDLRAALGERGISDDFILSCTTRCTTTKTRVLVHNQQIARIDEESTKPLEAPDEEKMLALVEQALPTVSAVVLSDYAKGCLTRSLTEKAIRLARDAGKMVIVDPKSRDLTKYNGASLLTPNLFEALHAAGIDSRSEDDAEAAANAILAAASIDSLLITLGEHGMKLFERGGRPIHFPSLARQVFDVTGAGDTVAATLAAAAAAGADTRSSIELANIAAGIAVEKVGTSTVTPEELKTAILNLSEHPIS